MRDSLIVSLMILVISFDVDAPVEGGTMLVNLYRNCFADTSAYIDTEIIRMVQMYGIKI